MLTIGLVGRAQQGKSTAANAMLREATSQGLRANVFEISQYVLNEAIDLNRVPAKEREKLTPEEIEQLVVLGVERRTQNPHYWLNTMFADIKIKNPDVAIVPNIRFTNEAEGIRSVYKGFIVRIKSYIVDGVEYISADRNPNHAMEIEHLSIPADYYLTTRRGESKLLSMQAATLFNYLYARQ
jgi:hypothetical protein